MRFTVTTGASRGALAMARRAIGERPRCAILAAALVEASDGTVRCHGHSLDYCSAGMAAADVSEDGSVAIDANKLTRLLRALPSDAVLDVEGHGNVVTISRGSSRWKLPSLPPSDFPAPLKPEDGAPEFCLPADDIVSLFGASAAAAGNDPVRPYLNGLFLHSDGDRLCVCATDGTALMTSRTAVSGAERLPVNDVARGARGVLIPLAAVGEIRRLGRADGCTLVTDGRIVEARSAAGVFASKLRDERFPDFRRYVSPPAAGATVELDAASLLMALQRALAVGAYLEKLPATVGLSWRAGDDAVRVELPCEPDAVDDTVPAAAIGAARIALPARRLSDLIEAMACKRIRLTASVPVRIEPVGEGSPLLVAVLMNAKAAWPRQEAA